MADLAIALELTGRDSGASAAANQVAGSLRNVGDSAEHATQKSGGLGSALGNVAQVAGGFIVARGLMELPGLLSNAAKAAAEEEGGVQRLATAVNNAGGSWEAQSKSIEGAIHSREMLGFSDDALRSSLAMLTAQTGSTDEAFRRQKLAMDLSRGAHIPLETASKLLGKVTEDNVNVLGRYGIAVEKGSTETELFAKIQEKFGGQAEAAAGTASVQWEIFQNQLGNLQEDIGGALLPVMTNLGGAAVSFIEDMRQSGDLQSIIDGLTGAFGMLGELAMQAFNVIRAAVSSDLFQGILDQVRQFAAAVQSGFDLVASVISAVIAGDIVVAIQLLEENLDIDLGPFIGAFQTAFNVVQGIWQQLTDAWVTVQQVLASDWEASAGIDPFVNALGMAVTFIRDTAMPAIQAAITTALTFVAALWETHGTTILAIAQTVWTAIQTAIQTVLGVVVPFIVQEFSVVSAWVETNWPLIQRTIETVWTAIQTVVNTVLPPIVQLITDNWTTIQTVTTAVWTIIQTLIDTTLTVILGLIRTAMLLLTGDWTGAWEEIQRLLKVAWDAMVVIIEQVGVIVLAAVAAIWKAIQDAIPAAWAAIQTAISTAWESIRLAIAGTVQSWLAVGTDIAGALMKGITDFISGAIPGMVNQLIEGARGAIGGVQGLFGGGGGGLQQTSLRSGGGGGGGGSRSGNQALVGDVVRQLGGNVEDAQVLMAITQTEGGLTGAVGDSGGSFGPFQFNINGQLQGYARWLGVSLEQAKAAANDITLATQYAFSTYLGGALQSGRAQGLSGADLATYVQRYGQVSVHPETTGANYNAMFGGGSAAAGALTEQYRQAQGMLPQYAAGGMVPGTQGVAQTAIVHGGEAVLNPQQIEAVNAALAAQGTTLQSLAGFTETAASAQGELSNSMNGLTPHAEQIKKQMDDLAAAIGQGFPQATGKGTAELKLFGEGAQAIFADLSSGNIAVDDAAQAMIRLASSTGLSIAPAQQMEAGLIGQDQALAQVLATAAEVNPAYANIAAGFIEGATGATQTTLDFLQLAISTQGVTDAVIPADQALRTMAGYMPTVSQLAIEGALSGDQLTATLIGLSNSSGLVKSSLDLQTASSSELNAEISRIIDEIAIVDPRFQALADTIKLQGGVTSETTGQFVNLLDTIDNTPDAVAPAIEAHTNLGTAAQTAQQTTQQAWEAILREIAASVKSIDESVKRLADAVIGYLGKIDSAKADVHVETSTAVKNLNKLEDKAQDAWKAIQRLADAPKKSATSKDVEKIFGFAGGGDVLGRVPIIVGEKGPELFVPSSNGYIVPTDDLSSGGSRLGGNGGTTLYATFVNHGVLVAADADDWLVDSLKRLTREGRMDGVEIG